MQTRRQFLQLAGATAAAPMCFQRALALDYPTRPVRIIVAFVPGGPSDIFGRIAAQKLSEQFGKQFYVENVAGGGGNIAAAQAARAAPDAVVRANPGRYTFASGGAGAQPHLAFEQFRLSLGLDIVHVPFGGAGASVASVVAGEVS